MIPRRLPDPGGQLFVYGTLLRGGRDAGLLADLEPRSARVRGALYLLPAGYPALRTDRGGRWIHGELVALDDPRRLRLLDLNRGVGQGLFTRAVLPVAADDGRSTTAWAYVVAAPALRRAKARRLQIDHWRRMRGWGR